jgi:two-component system response regulator YesN
MRKLKAVLFDDEFIALEALSSAVDWEGLNIELAGTAMDGLTALELVRRVRPDIVLTDIRMPGMSGLDLIEKVMAEFPEVRCIVFSGFNEFDYVKRAIRLGVADYVEKPITETAIEQALRKALGQLERERAVRSMERMLQSSGEALLEKAVRDLLLSGGEADLSALDQFGLDEERLSGVTVLASAEPFNVPDHPAYRVVYLREEKDFLAVMFHFLELPPAHWDSIFDELESAGKTVGAGLTYPTAEGARSSLKEARHALKGALLLGIRGGLKFGELGSWTDAPEQLSARMEAILISLRAGNREVLMREVDGYLQEIQEIRLDPECVECDMLKLVFAAEEAARELARDAGGEGRTEPPRHHIEIAEASAEGRLRAWFREKMAHFADLAAGRREREKHEAIEKAKQYVVQNAFRDVSLQETAEAVGLHPAYLSVLFKEVTGESFIKYLTRNRMELAKSLLRKGLKVNEVSERIGYMTPRHFSEVFKRYTGMTPGQFRDAPHQP